MINTGGYAYPRAPAYRADGDLIENGDPGMTLLQHYAGQAMAALIIAVHGGFDTNPIKPTPIQLRLRRAIADEAQAQAVAMIEAEARMWAAEKRDD